VLVAVLVLYAVQATYSSDADRALEQVVFFYVPFAVLFALLVRVPWTPRLVAWTLGVLVMLAVALAGVGFWEYETRRLLLNPRVINSNQFESYFRVNSLFFDPNIYGRFLIVVMLGIAAVVVWTARTRVALAGAIVLALLWAGLVLTFSQSSFVGLLVGLAVLGGLRWGAVRALAATGAVAVIGAAVVLLAPGSVRLDLGSEQSVQDATSGRYDLVAGGSELFTDKPVGGWGSGSFRREYRRSENASAERATNASHTIPVTVAAEQGIVGLVAYLALLVAALWRMAAGLRRSGASLTARAAVLAAFAALLVHTLLYAAFLEDPLTWALLALGSGLAAVAGSGAPADP
jgi:O-antigen ligase